MTQELTWRRRVVEQHEVDTENHQISLIVDSRTTLHSQLFSFRVERGREGKPARAVRVLRERSDVVQSLLVPGSFLTHTRRGHL